MVEYKSDPERGVHAPGGRLGRKDGAGNEEGRVEKTGKFPFTREGEP